MEPITTAALAKILSDISYIADGVTLSMAVKQLLAEGKSKELLKLITEINHTNNNELKSELEIALTMLKQAEDSHGRQEGILTEIFQQLKDLNEDRNLPPVVGGKGLFVGGNNPPDVEILEPYMEIRGFSGRKFEFLKLPFFITFKFRNNSPFALEKFSFQVKIKRGILQNFKLRHNVFEHYICEENGAVVFRIDERTLNRVEPGTSMNALCSKFTITKRNFDEYSNEFFYISVFLNSLKVERKIKLEDLLYFEGRHLTRNDFV